LTRPAIASSIEAVPENWQMSEARLYVRREEDEWKTDG
jgi:hypothetical protein